jgi:hypothetical protein
VIVEMIGLWTKKRRNANPIVKWSRDWPHHVGHWWLYRGNRTTDKIPLVHAAIDGSGKIMVMSPAEILYRQEQTSEWYFAPAILPAPPMSKEQSGNLITKQLSPFDRES